jgi:hypothetical protein
LRNLLRMQLRSILEPQEFLPQRAFFDSHT